MGGTTRAPLVASDPAVAAELARLLAATRAQTETAWRSPATNFVATSVALLVAFGPRLPGAPHVLGELTNQDAIGVAAIAWSAYELGVISFHLLGVDHAVSIATSALDSFVRQTSLLTLIYLSGSASSPLWLIAMISAFARAPKSTRRARSDLAILVTTYAALAIAFARTTRLGDAWLTVLVFLASLVGHTVSARMIARSARVRAERDVIERKLHETTLHQDRERMARELHDGLGADVMALVLQLRSAAQDGTNAKAARLADRARGLLDELRGVVWSLRNEQGTLAELGKLIDATSRSARGEIGYERTTPLAAQQTRIGPSAALAALSITRDFVRSAATREGVTKLKLTLSVGDALDLTVEDDGPPLSPEALHARRASIDASERALAAASSTIEITNLASSPGIRMHAAITLDSAHVRADDRYVT